VRRNEARGEHEEKTGTQGEVRVYLFNVERERRQCSINTDWQEAIQIRLSVSGECRGRRVPPI